MCPSGRPFDRQNEGSCKRQHVPMSREGGRKGAELGLFTLERRFQSIDIMTAGTVYMVGLVSFRVPEVVAADGGIFTKRQAVLGAWYQGARHIKSQCFLCPPFRCHRLEIATRDTVRLQVSSNTKLEKCIPCSFISVLASAPAPDPGTDRQEL